MREKKPKKGSKVLCIAEHPDWSRDSDHPPKLGWVYLVTDVERMDALFREADPKGKLLALTLLGCGEKRTDPDLIGGYRHDCFRVVGNGRIIRA